MQWLLVKSFKLSFLCNKMAHSVFIQMPLSWTFITGNFVCNLLIKTSNFATRMLHVVSAKLDYWIHLIEGLFKICLNVPFTRQKVNNSHNF